MIPKVYNKEWGYIEKFVNVVDWCVKERGGRLRVEQVMIFKHSTAYLFENDVIFCRNSLLRRISVFAVLIIDIFDEKM